MFFFIPVFIILLFISIIYFYTKQLKFGALPKGERLEKIKRSPHYQNEAFENISKTPSLTEGVSYYSVMKEFFFSKKIRRTPVNKLPSKKTDLLQLLIAEDVLIWFGHSSYFMQIDGKKILVDPVLSGAASPLSFTTRAFKGTDIYTTDEIPLIDYLFISHDHWDHLDHATISLLKPKIKKIICGLGIGEHLERWGFNKDSIIEKDWHEEIILEEGFTVNTIPARHFSGRGFKRNKVLWMSYALKTPTSNIFIGGDSGYDIHFEEAGKKLGPFDLAILENGQYDKSWKYIHMMPEEVLLAAQELQAKKLLAVHSAKFALANHPWDEPLTRITTLNYPKKIILLTPMIGEQVNIKANDQIFSHWWKGIK